MDVTPMHVAFEEVKKDAEDLSIAVTGSELVCGYFCSDRSPRRHNVGSVCLRESVCVLQRGLKRKIWRKIRRKSMRKIKREFTWEFKRKHKRELR